MPAPPQNTYAAKPAEAHVSAARVMAGFTPPEKKRVMRAHGGRGSLGRYVALAALAALDAGLPVLATDRQRQ